MNKKTLARVAIFMIIVFGATILLYPTLYNSETKPGEAIEAPPVPETK